MSYEKRREKEFKKFVRECRIELEEEVHEVFLQKQEYSHRGVSVPDTILFYEAGLIYGLTYVRQIEKML